MMNCVGKMASSPDIKPEIIDLEDTESVESSKHGLDATPEWILVFTKQLLKINGQRSPEKLDRMMGEYLELMRVELMQCQISPNRSYHIASKMQKFLAYFYGYYQDIREFFVVTRWNENVVELMAIYSYLELKAAIRLKRRETDQALASRIYKMLYLYFEGNEEHIIHTFLKTPMSNLKCKSIYDLIFRKVLVTNRSKSPQTHSELEYIRNLLCFKIWKTMYPKADKHIVTNFALSHNKPPSNLSNFIRKFRFIPKALGASDLHNKLCTIPLQIDDGVREYFERLVSKNDKHFGSVKTKDKKTFISKLFDVFSNIGSTTDDVGDSFMDNLLLDQIKTETEEICFEEDENSDDDCVFVDPNQPVPPPVTEPPLDILIDLTSNEPDTEDGEPSDLTPTWCIRILNQENTANAEPIAAAVCEPIDDQPQIPQLEYETVTNKLKDCELQNKSTDCQPVNVVNVEIVNIKSSTDPAVINGYKSADIEMDCEPVNKLTNCKPLCPMAHNIKTVDLKNDCELVNWLVNCKSVNKDYKRISETIKVDFQPVNGTSKHYKPEDTPKLCPKSATVNNISRKPVDFESEICNTDSQSNHKKTITTKPLFLEPEYLQPMNCEPVICNTSKTKHGKSISSNIINGYSVNETDFESMTNCEPVNNNVVPLKHNGDHCSSRKSRAINATVNCEPVNRNAEGVLNRSTRKSRAGAEPGIPSVNCEPINTTVTCEAVNTAVDCEPINTTENCEVVNTTVNCEPVKTTVDCEPVKTTVDCETVKRTVSCESVKTTMSCESVNATVSCEPVNTTVNCEPVELEPVSRNVEGVVDHSIRKSRAEVEPGNCEPVELEAVNRNAEDDHNTMESLEVENYLNDLQTEAEFCEPVINRENINKTPLDIIDDFCASEDEYSLPEITSTSHDFVPVKLQSISVQAREKSPVRNLVHSRAKVPLTTKHYQTSRTGCKIVVRDSETTPNNWDKADSTSNFNEPAITPFFAEENIELRDDDSFSAMSSDAPSPITNIFDSFTAKHSTNHSIESIVSTPKVHDLSKLVPQLLDESDSVSETSSTEGNLVINSNNTTADTEEKSPTMEPISGRDYANYLSQFNSDRQNELVVNKNVKIRTYNSSKPRPKPALPEEARDSVIAQPERRVPVNGEKVLRFETELWEDLYLKTFKLTKKEYQFFNPQVRVCNSDKRDYGVFDDDVEPGLLFSSGSGTAVKGGCIGLDALHSYNTARTMTILERQDYVKDDKQTRALVETRPLRSKSASRKYGEAASSNRQSAATSQAKKRGTKSSTTEVTKKRKLSRKNTALTAPDSETRDEQTISPWRY